VRENGLSDGMVDRECRRARKTTYSADALVQHVATDYYDAAGDNTYSTFFIIIVVVVFVVITIRNPCGIGVGMREIGAPG
jgi:hypothetical protein